LGTRFPGAVDYLKECFPHAVVEVVKVTWRLALKSMIDVHVV